MRRNFYFLTSVTYNLRDHRRPHPDIIYRNKQKWLFLIVYTGSQQMKYLQMELETINQKNRRNVEYNLNKYLW